MIWSENGALVIHTAKILLLMKRILHLTWALLKILISLLQKCLLNLEMYVFSATIPENLKPFLKKYMESPVHVKIGERKSLTEGMHYSLVPVRGMNKKKKLLQVLEGITSLFGNYLYEYKKKC